MYSFCFILLLAFRNVGAINAAPQNGFLDNGALGRALAGVDISPVTALLKQSKQLLFIDPDSAFALSQRALQASSRIGYARGIACSLLYMASTQYAREDYAKIGRYVEEAAPYCFDAAIEDRSLVPTLYIHQANVFKARGVFDSALCMLYKALRLLEPDESVNRNALKVVYSNIAATLGAAGQFDKVFFYARKGIALADRLRDTQGLAQNYLNIGHTHSCMGNFDSARSYLYKAIDLSNRIGHRKDAMDAFVVMGTTWSAQNKPERYKACLDSATLESRKLAYDDLSLQQNYGYFYLQKKDYKRALSRYQRMLDIATRKGIVSANLDVYYRLAECCYRLGRGAEAYELQKKYTDLTDSFSALSKTKNANTLEVQYRTAEKDKELMKKKLQLVLAQNRLSNSNSRTLAAVAGVVIMFITMIIIFQKQRLLLHKEKAEKQVTRVAQLKAVIEGEEKERSRIGRELHDDIMVELSVMKMGLNALSLQSSDIRNKGGYTDLVQQLNRTCQKLRLTAHNLMPDALLSDGLVSAITYFCSNVAKMTGLHIHFQHYGNIPRLFPDIEISVYRIVQELVQNIIKHAEAANALVQLNYREDLLSITVEDDGVGFSPALYDQDNKMGFKSIQTRLKAMHGTIDILARNPHGTSVTISLSMSMPDNKKDSL